MLRQYRSNNLETERELHVADLCFFYPVRLIGFGVRDTGGTVRGTGSAFVATLLRVDATAPPGMPGTR
jgi:hypothetical protein